MSQPAPDDLIGRVFDRKYRINELIGSGGMGSVYRATHLDMSREVALKVLDHGVADSDKQVQRFNREARSSSRLQHPNTIRVYDFGRSEESRLYLAMELLKGETLAELMRRERRLPLPRACHLVRQVCKSLAEAHDLGLVHRDLKPDNIFVTEVFGEADFVKVLDFGIAKSTEADGQENLTQTGFICGTPRYLSPEQAMGKPVDGRSDLYAIGVLLFELLTGASPFNATTPIGLVMKHIKEPAPPLPHDGSPAGASMARLIAQRREKTPELRPSDALVVASSLSAIFDGVDAPRRTPSGSLAGAAQPAPWVSPGSQGAPGGGMDPSGLQGHGASTRGDERHDEAQNATMVLDGGSAAAPWDPAMPAALAPAPALIGEDDPTHHRPVPRDLADLRPPATDDRPIAAPPRAVRPVSAARTVSRPSGARPAPHQDGPRPVHAPLSADRDNEPTLARPNPLDAPPPEAPRRHTGLHRVVRSGPPDSRPVAAVALTRAPRREPTDEIPQPARRSPWRWLWLLVYAGLITAIILMVSHAEASPLLPRVPAVSR